MMSNNGLSKLIEECGEVVQVAAKLLAYPDGEHPDGKGNLYTRLEDEIADLTAALIFVEDKLALDLRRVMELSQHKINMFRQWDREP